MISNVELQDMMKMHRLAMMTRKCRDYCARVGVDIEKYYVKGTNRPKVYRLPVELAIGIVESSTVKNKNRWDALEKLYAMRDEKVDRVRDVVEQLGYTLLWEDGRWYVPEKGVVIDLH